jgi:hypothetical protein
MGPWRMLAVCPARRPNAVEGFLICRPTANAVLESASRLKGIPTRPAVKNQAGFINRGKVRFSVKLILKIASGIILGVGLIALGIYSYNRYTHRSTANQYEWEGAKHFMDILVDMPEVSSTKKAEMAGETCQNFHINHDDCMQLVKEAYDKANAKATKK